MGCHLWRQRPRVEATSQLILVDYDTSFHFLLSHAYRLGHFDIKPLFLLRSSYKTPTRQESCGKSSAVARAFQGPPRPSQHHRYARIIDGDIGPPRTPKRNLRRSWTHESVHSTSETQVRAHERRAKRESSLVIGAADISWTATRQLALTAWRQLAKNQVPDSTSHKLTVCRPMGMETDVFRNLLRRFLEFLREMSHKK